MNSEITIAGIPVDNLDRSEAINRIGRIADSGDQTCVFFVNAEAVVLSRHNTTYRHALLKAGLRLIDGVGMIIAGRLRGEKFKANNNGTDLFPDLCTMLSSAGKTVFLLGGKENRAQKTAEWMQEQYPGIRVVGTAPGYFTKSEESGLLASIQRLRPKVILVGLGSPKQELWLQNHIRETGASVGVGVGGLFDFYSGLTQRAPFWMRKIGLEWVWRMAREPRRWFRLMRLFEFVYIILTGKDS